MTTAARSSFLDKVEVYQQPDYSVIIDGQISPRYQNIPESQLECIKALYYSGQKNLAQRMADCYRAGTIYRKCSRGRYAEGYKHRCGILTCVWCSRPKLRLSKFADSRDHTIFSKACIGIEFFDNNLKLPQLRLAVREFIKSNVGPDALMADSFDIHQSSVRCVIPAESADRKRLQRLWDGNLSVKISDDPRSIYLWVFSGMLGISGVSANDKAEFHKRIKGVRLIRTIGDFYSPDPSCNQEHTPTQCPICQDHDLDDIPMADRHNEQVEDAEKRFEHVAWGKEKDVRRYYPTHNPEWVYRNYPNTPTVSASPPPW